MPNRIVPLELRKLRGNPSRRPIPCVPQGARLSEPPEPPTWLATQARQEWLRLSPELHQLGLLTTLDLSTFAVVCATIGHWLECEAELERLRADAAYPALLSGPLGKVAREYARDSVKYRLPHNSMSGPLFADVERTHPFEPIRKLKHLGIG